MNFVCVPQRLVPRQCLVLPMVLAFSVLSLGCSGSSEKTKNAASRNVENQTADGSEKKSKLDASSIPATIGNVPAAPSTRKIEISQTPVQEDTSGKQDPSKNANSPRTTAPDATSRDVTTQDATNQPGAKLTDSATKDAGTEKSMAAGLGKTATEILENDANPNVNSDVGEDEELSESDDQAEFARPQFEVADEQTIEIPATWTRLGKNEIWIDVKNKQVILAGYICINVGALEMFACPAGTKEHESVVAVNALASEMHAALLAVGAEPGAPCSWDDVSFTTASGSKINIDVRWRDEKTNEIVTRAAKEMMKVEGEQKLEIEWIFGGSRFLENVEAKFRSYSANSGEMICVSNFSTAAIDVNIDSTDAEGSWLFWANTEKVPPRGTRVYLILSPGDYFKAQRHVFADSQPAPLENQEENKEPEAGEANAKDDPPSEIKPLETSQPEPPPASEKTSSDKE